MDDQDFLVAQDWEVWRAAQESRRKRKLRLEFRKFREVLFLTSIPFWCVLVCACVAALFIGD